MTDNDKVQVAIPLAVPLAGTTSRARPRHGRRILALEEAAVFQGYMIHLEHRVDGTNFRPLLTVERSSNRLLLLDLAHPTTGYVRVRLDMPQANSHGFTLITR